MEFSSQNSIIDAQPVSSFLPPAPTGLYQLQLGPAEETENQCINDPSQVSSWDCNVSDPGAMALSVQNSPIGQVASVYQCTNDTRATFGTKNILTQPASLRVVKDPDAISYGLAWQFQYVYTKVVVAQDDLFQPAQVGANASSPTSSSTPAPTGSSRMAKRFWAPLVKPGDQPWYCYWNNTVVEGFIYMSENSTSWFTNKTASGQGRVYKGVKRADTGSSTNAPSSSVPYTTVPPATLSATSSSSASSSSPTGNNNGNGNGGNGGGPPHPYYNWPDLEVYPYIVKLEERRTTGDTFQPYCQKMQILNDGTAAPVMDPESGMPILRNISATAPSSGAYQGVYGTSGNNNRKRTTVPGACHCQWMSGEN